MASEDHIESTFLMIKPDGVQRRLVGEIISRVEEKGLKLRALKLKNLDEMREYLHSGPCTEELIDPIIQWVYFGDSINRHHFEEYLEAFRKCPLIIENIYFGYDAPDIETLASLHSKYGVEHDFTCASISTVLRKSPDGPEVQRLFFRIYITLRRILGQWSKRQIMRIRLLIRIFLIPFSPFLKLWRTLFRST